MRRIKPLPEVVHSSLRSGSILHDLTSIVEELIFNSLDAGAGKVSVYISLGTCYVKVVDNGSGITRDGLVLLGERYATSKLYNLDDMDAASESFGYRGEALGSISDVSLLDIVTKTHGRPNGFRKVMKGCKCLYLGIDDERQDVGTTVIVRDLFYNQPVRRKQMQSSPKKVLDSVKKCVLQIAFVRSMVSFKVVDIESEDELLYTHPSFSPLSLLTSCLGVEFLSSLHEINLSDGVLQLSGFSSYPCETLPAKVFQYVYINSRFVRKGPIHKLLSQMAAKFNRLDLSKSIGAQNVKRSRSQASAAYILNLSCPRSLYDLSFEPLKADVEFKDWVPVLNFIEKAITGLWSKNIAHGESFDQATDISERAELWEGDKVESAQENSFLSQQLCRNNAELDDQQSEMESVHQTEYSLPFKDIDANGIHAVKEGGDPWAPENNCFSKEHYFMNKRFIATEKSNGHVDDYILDCRQWTAFVEDDAGLGTISMEGQLSSDYLELNNELGEVHEHLKKPFLQNCSSRQSLPTEWGFYLENNGFDNEIKTFRAKRKRLYLDDMVDIVDAAERFDFLPSTLCQDEATCAQNSFRIIRKCDNHADMDFLSKDLEKSSSFDGVSFADKIELRDSVVETRNFGSDHCSNSEWYSRTTDLLYGTRLWDVEDISCENACGGSSKFSATNGNFLEGEWKDCILINDFMRTTASGKNCLSIDSDFGLDFKGFAPKRENSKFLRARNLDDSFSLGRFDILKNEVDWLCLDSCRADNKENCAESPHHIPSFIYMDEDRNHQDPQRNQDCGQDYVPKERLRRSHSAPPFLRCWSKFVTLNSCWTANADKPKNKATLPESTELNHPWKSSGIDHPFSKPSFVNDFLFHTRSEFSKTKKMHDIPSNANEILRNQKFHEPQHVHVSNIDSVKGTNSKEKEASINFAVKWRFGIPPIANEDRSHKFHDQSTILDISSGILHLAGDSLIPESINKKCLEDAQVLQQVDKKFIPVVAGGTLAIIDQHAADERIRLEELRRKVLSGEMNTVTYLDTEKELALPEVGYQLLHNYADQIRSWGWICNIHCQSSGSFTKNLNLLHRQPTVVKLLAVPCILGVDLSDLDLLEFLQQLADTDGTSIMPPSVLRVLNFKACRGAIMFGDTLLLSECSLIVEELKQTALCFQCAHGRPTTAPLVNLEALHKQIRRLQINGGSNESWHGLQRHEVSFVRTAQRLNPARGQCG